MEDYEILFCGFVLFMCVFWVGFIIWVSNDDLKKAYTPEEFEERKYWDPEKRKETDKIRKKAYYDKLKEERAAQRAKREEERAARRASGDTAGARFVQSVKASMDVHPVKTQIIGIGHNEKKTGTVGRAVVGAAVAGPVGALVGAASAGTKQVGDNVSFLVYYSDDHKDIVTVPKGSGRYKELMAILDTENPMA